jgi:hypothetical protein
MKKMLATQFSFFFFFYMSIQEGEGGFELVFNNKKIGNTIFLCGSQNSWIHRELVWDYV